MPFRVSWTDPANLQFNSLTDPFDIVLTRHLVGSFEHDGWVRGRIVSDPTVTGVDLRELENGPILLRYELLMDSESVRIMSVRTA